MSASYSGNIQSRPGGQLRDRMSRQALRRAGGELWPTGQAGLDGSAGRLNARDEQVCNADPHLSGPWSTFDDHGTGQAMVAEMLADAEYLDIDLLGRHPQRGSKLVFVLPTTRRLGQPTFHIGQARSGQRQE